MSNTAKFGLFALVAATIAAVVYGNRTVSGWVKNLSVKVTALGIPVLVGGNLSVPVTLAINNPLPTSVPISSLTVGLFILRNGMYVQFGQAIQNAFTLNAGSNTLTLRPVIDLSKLTPNQPNWITALNILASQRELATIKIMTRVNVQGITWDGEETRSLTLNQLINAAA